MLWDGGSTLSFITFDKAKELCLHGQPTNLEITTVNDTKCLNSMRYKLKMIDKHSNLIEIEAYGIERISTATSVIDPNVLSRIFAIDPSTILRPNGAEIDILIGMQYAAYHPVRIEAKGHLLLLENQFGFVIAGSHPEIKKPAKVLVQHAVVLHSVATIDTFHNIESLGVSCIPKCGSCACGKCHTGGKNMSIQEEYELEMIQNNLKFNDNSGRWVACYPWLRNPNTLPNNRSYAVATLVSTERRLIRNKQYADLYARQIQDMLNRGAARKVSEAEIDNYEGPKFYLSHHAVLKPESKSTPCRIVFNSSARFQGHSLNDYLAKGPSLLNQLLGILLRFREKPIAFIGDISKMFHSIEIPIQDQMTHLFLWRNFETSDEPLTFAMTRVNMGDRPSSAIAQAALQKTAEEALQEHPKAADTILKDSYMDDIISSVDDTESAKRVMSEIETVLKLKGFTIKEWIWSGTKLGSEDRNVDQSAVQILMESNSDNDETEKVLGLHWDVRNDLLVFHMKFTGEGTSITKRKILSIINSIYDPLGLLSPVTVRAKIIMRRIWACHPNIRWDDCLPLDLADEWSKIYEDLKKVNLLKIPEVIKAKGYFRRSNASNIFR